MPAGGMSREFNDAMFIFTDNASEWQWYIQGDAERHISLDIQGHVDAGKN